MIFYKHYNLLNYTSNVIYTEGNFHFCYSIFGVNKMAILPYFIVEIREGKFVFYISIFFYDFFVGAKNNILLLKWLETFYIWIDFFKSVLFGYFSRIRIVGRGYKLFVDINNLIFRLGYSHNIYFLIPLKMVVLKKEKNSNFWKFIGLSNALVSKLCYELKSFKLPDVYTNKGIFRANDLPKKKQGKKAFSL